MITSWLSKKGIMRDLSLCKFFEQKNLNLIDLILYKSIIKSLEKSDFLTFDTKQISEYILVLYFKLIRNKTIPIQKRDFVHKSVVRLIEKSKLITLKNTSELSDKDFFVILKRHSDYTTTIEKINKHINRFTLIKNQIGPSEKLIYDYDQSSKVITILEKKELTNSLECINLYIKNHYKYKSKQYKDENALKLIRKQSNESIEEVNTNSKIPISYQLTKHKSMKTKDLFEQFDIFLENKSINHHDADLNQFYMFLKNHYKNQSYNRNNLIQFIKKYYRPDYDLFIEEEIVNLTNQFRYFKELDILNIQLGFNLTELITINDLNNLLNHPKKESNVKFIAKSNFSDYDFNFIEYFKGLDYSNMDEVERYNAFLANQKIIRNIDLYQDKLDYQLSLVDPIYSRKEILNYLRFSGYFKLYDILAQEEFWNKRDAFFRAPYLVKTLIDVLTEFRNPLLDRLGDYIDSILTDREQYIHQERFNKRTLESLGTKMGLTRERVRQIESKAKKKLKSNKSLKIIQKLNPLIQSKFSSLYNIVIEDVENVLGRFTSVFIELNIFHNEDFAYFENEEYMTFKKHELSRVDNFIETFENYFDRNEYHLKKENYKVFFPKIDPDIFDSQMLKRFEINSDYYFDKKHFKTKSDRVKFILFEYYPEGIKVFDDEMISDFTSKYQKFFGIDDFKNQSTRTVGSYITRYTKIIGRGLYSIASKSIELDTEIVDYISSLIYESKLIYKETLLYRVKSRFNHLSFESMEEFSRVLKKYINFPSNRFYFSVEEEYLDYQRYLVEFLENNSGVFRIEDIETEFKGINQKTILNIYNQSDLVLSNNNHRYIHVKHVGLNNNELNTIKLIIDQLIEKEDYIHVLDVYEKILMDDSIVMDEEVLNDSLGLFNVIKYYFSEEYSLFRPLIGKSNVFIGPFESMIDHYFFSSEIVEIETLKKFIDYMQKPTAIHAIFEIQHPKYYLINSKEFRLKASLGITSQVSNTIEKIMKNFMKGNPNLGIEDFTQWNLLPKIKVDWTPQLIYSLAKDDFHDINIKFSIKKYNNLKFRIEWRT